MKKNLLIFALIVLVIVNVSALVTIIHGRWSRIPHFRGERGPEHPLALFREQLELDDSQLAELKARRSLFETELAEVHNKMEEGRKALMEELRAESPDTVRIDGLIDEIGMLQAQVQKRAIRHMLQEQEILTPEQREKMFSMFDRHFRQRTQFPWRGPKGPRKHHPGPFRSERKGRQERPPKDPGRDESREGRGQ